MSDKIEGDTTDLAPRSRKHRGASVSPRKVLRRKTRIDAPSIAADAAADKNPAAQASLIAAAWHGGVEALIDAGTLMMESLQAFGDDAERLDAFITGLVDAHLLTPREARLRLVSPKLVKLRAIGENADFLRRRDMTACVGGARSSRAALFKKERESSTSAARRVRC